MSCDQGAGTCTVRVPAPGFALVELDGADTPGSTATFATTAVAKHGMTVKLDPSAVATSNGHSGKNRPSGGTSHGGSSSGSSPLGLGPGVLTLLALGVGAGVLLRALLRQI